MPQFQYEAFDSTGKKLSGSLQAESETVARQQLRAKGLAVKSLTEAKAALSASNFSFVTLLQRRVRMPDIILFTKQFQTLFTAGIALPQIFGILSKQAENKRLGEAAADINRRLQEGESLEQAFSAQKRIFTPLYCAMIRAGEQSGSLPEVLDRLTVVLEHDERVHQKVVAAMRYPKMVAVFMVGAFLVLLNYVIPQFASLYNKSNVELPLPTQIAIVLNQLCMQYWWILLTVVVGTVFVFKRIYASDAGKLWFDTMALRIPLIGPVVQKASVSRFASILSILLKSGLSVINSLDIVRDTIENHYFRTKFAGMKEDIQAGSAIAPAISKVGGFGPLAVNLVTVGESAGNLEDMLNELSRHYDIEVNAAVDKMTDWIGPIMIVCLGVIMLFFSLAIFLPMWDMSKFAM